MNFLVNNVELMMIILLFLFDKFIIIYVEINISQDIKDLMDNAKHGVIYYSMGSIWKSKDMPEGIKRDLLKVFGELKETVIWKFEEDLPNLPKNVHVLKWAPQTSILGK